MSARQYRRAIGGRWAAMLVLGAAGAAVGCGGCGETTKLEQQVHLDNAGNLLIDAVEKLEIEDLQVGKGKLVVDGDVVTIRYTIHFEGSPLADHQEQLLTFEVGDAMMITGLEQGVVGMRVGGVRRLRVPPGQAYGERGLPGKLPPKATLTIVVALQKLAKAS